MDLQISVFLLFVLFTAGHSFSCYECIGSCADQTVKACPSGASKCMSLSTVAQADGTTAKVNFKSCAADCISGSMDFGVVKTSFACCKTDKCNIQDAPDPSNAPNGNTCYFCDGQSCSNLLNCSGSETRCIKATAGYGGQSMVTKGCASQSICDATATASVPDVGSLSCCEGNLCNGAKSVTQSLFLCGSLLFFTLLH